MRSYSGPYAVPSTDDTMKSKADRVPVLKEDRTPWKGAAVMQPYVGRSRKAFCDLKVRRVLVPVFVIQLSKHFKEQVNLIMTSPCSQKAPLVWGLALV